MSCSSLNVLTVRTGAVAVTVSALAWSSEVGVRLLLLLLALRGGVVCLSSLLLDCGVCGRCGVGEFLAPLRVCALVRFTTGLCMSRLDAAPGVSGVSSSTSSVRARAHGGMPALFSRGSSVLHALSSVHEGAVSSFSFFSASLLACLCA